MFLSADCVWLGLWQRDLIKNGLLIIILIRNSICTSGVEYHNLHTCNKSLLFLFARGMHLEISKTESKKESN